MRKALSRKHLRASTRLRRPALSMRCVEWINAAEGAPAHVHIGESSGTLPPAVAGCDHDGSTRDVGRNERTDTPAIQSAGYAVADPGLEFGVNAASRKHSNDGVTWDKGRKTVEGYFAYHAHRITRLSAAQQPTTTGIIEHVVVHWGHLERRKLSDGDVIHRCSADLVYRDLLHLLEVGLDGHRT